MTTVILVLFFLVGSVFGDTLDGSIVPNSTIKASDINTKFLAVKEVLVKNY